MNIVKMNLNSYTSIRNNQMNVMYSDCTQTYLIDAFV